MHSPDMVRHMAVRRNLESLLWNYVNLRGLGTVLVEKGLCVFPRNDCMRDVIFFGSEKAAGLQPEQLHLPVPSSTSGWGMAISRQGLRVIEVYRG